ncbi:MAG TPA: hypothetical protein VF469_30710 [Kofleriaceae bacterium]
MWEDDYILRVIQQLADAIARIVGLNQRAEYDRALAEAEQAWSELLDLPAGLADAVDSRTLAGMLREPARIRLAAQLAQEHARALTGKGDTHGAALRSRRALELLLEARALAAAEPTDEATLRELQRVVSLDALAPRYRAMLAGAA